MSYYAKVKEGIVVDIIVAEESFFDTFVDDSPGEYIKTDYATYGDVHYNIETREPDGGTPLRKNHAVVDGTYDVENDAFYDPQPFPSWTLNEDTYLWEPPTNRPSDGKIYRWNEATTNWVEIEE